MELQNLYQELIIDHGREPRNFSRLENASHFALGHNPLCGDKIELFLRIEEDRIIAASFQGVGCAISTASASLMTESLLGKTLQEASLLFEALQNLLTKENNINNNEKHTGNINENNKEDISDDSCLKLGKLAALSGVSAFPARVKCASLPWHTLLAALKQKQITCPKISTGLTVSTE